MAHGPSPVGRGARAARLLEDRELGWSGDRGEGVVLYADAPADGRTRRYAVIGESRERLEVLERRLEREMGFEP